MTVSLENHLKTLGNLLIKSAASFIFINGPAECGKSHLLQSLTELDGLSSKVLYIDSLECVTMTILYERLLSFITNSQQQRQLRTANSASSVKPCSTVTEMVTRLSSLNWPANHKIVLLIDEADRLFQMDSNSFSVLLRLPEMFDHKISLVMASREEFDDFGPSVTGGLIPVKISIKSFTAEETCEIITEQLKSEEIDAKRVKNCFYLVKQIANSTVKDLSILKNLTFSAATTNVPNSSSSNQHRLVSFIQNRLNSSNQLDSFYQQTSNSLNLIEKYLLISGYIASFQTARDDLKVFWSEESNSKKKSRKLYNPAKDPINTNSKSVDKLTLKLPKLFDQTRLIAIFYHNIQQLDPLPSPQQLQLTIKSLCDRGLLKTSGNSAVKIDSLKYRINISQDFAIKLAKGLEIELNNLMI